LEECVFNSQGEFKLRYSRRQEITALAAFLLFCLGLGLTGSLLAGGAAHGWLLSLSPPPNLQPHWLYTPFQAASYLLLGVAAWEIWRAPDVNLRSQNALHVWGWQIGLNAIWISVFFGLHLLLPSLAIGVALLGAAAFTFWHFARLNRTAALLLLPYSGWITFEIYLNAGFWWLNR
jgi:benzodiazapine receptor